MVSVDTSPELPRPSTATLRTPSYSSPSFRYRRRQSTARIGREALRTLRVPHRQLVTCSSSPPGVLSFVKTLVYSEKNCDELSFFVEIISCSTSTTPVL